MKNPIYANASDSGNILSPSHSEQAQSESLQTKLRLRYFS